MNRIRIQTKYDSEEAFIKALSVHSGRSHLFYNYKSQLWAEVKANKELILTCDGKRMGKFEFVGQFESEENGVVLKGHVQKRTDILKRYKMYGVFGLVMGVFLIITMNPVFMFMGLLFLLVTGLNQKMYQSDAPFIRFLEQKLQR